MTTRRFLIIGACALTSALALNFVVREIHMSGGIAGHTVSPAPTIPALSRSLRPNYPYSVIPGGAYSPTELRVVNEKDALIRDHYSDFDLRSARLVMLTEDRYQYVSFRLKNRIYWTHNRLRIPKGEVLLTDGYSYARTRCGNRLSSTPKSNTTPLQPPARLLSLPPYSPQLLSQLPFATPPLVEIPPQFAALPFESRLAPPFPAPIAPRESWPPIQIYPPIIPVSVGYVPTPKTPPPTIPPIIPPTTPPGISHVPEPASISLFGVASCLCLWLSARAIRRRREAERLNEVEE